MAATWHRPQPAATRGTARYFREHGLDVGDVYKVLEGRPNAVDLMKNGEIDIVLNTPLGGDSYFDELALRRTATQRRIPLITTLSGGAAMVEAIRAFRERGLEVTTLQEIYPESVPERSGASG